MFRINHYNFDTDDEYTYPTTYPTKIDAEVVAEGYAERSHERCTEPSCHLVAGDGRFSLHHDNVERVRYTVVPV